MNAEYFKKLLQHYEAVDAEIPSETLIEFKNILVELDNQVKEFKDVREYLKRLIKKGLIKDCFTLKKSYGSRVITPEDAQRLYQDYGLETMRPKSLKDLVIIIGEEEVEKYTTPGKQVETLQYKK